MALSKSKKMAKERERLFQEAKEKAKAERQSGRVTSSMGVPQHHIPKAYSEDGAKKSSGWSSSHIETAGMQQSGRIKLITEDVTSNFREPEVKQYVIATLTENKRKNYKVKATSISEAYRKVETYLEQNKIYHYKLGEIKEVI